MAKIKPEFETNIRMKVVGVGGAGGNAITRMADHKIKGISFIAINTDDQALHHSKADEKIAIGKVLTRGLGAGMNPEIGYESAKENMEQIENAVKGSDLVFVTAGLGGGTGSGASPVVAELARKNGALVISVVTKPFGFEGGKRQEIADEAWQKLQEQSDAIITVPNDKVFNLIDSSTPILTAFSLIDDILYQGVKGISDLITYPGIINLDFANIRTIMTNAGEALMGTGRASGEGRAQKAAQAAVHSPLLETQINGATRVLFNVSGGPDLSLAEINEAAKVITETIDPNAKVIFGAIYDEGLKKGEIKITVIAGGFNENTFDEKNLVLPFVRPIVTSKKADASVPFDTKADFTFANNTNKKEAVSANNSVKVEINTDTNSKEVKTNEEKIEDIEIPAFLRKKKRF